MTPWLPLALLLMALVAALSLMPGSSEPVRSSPRALQKAGHVALYAVVAALWVPVLRSGGMALASAAVAAWGLATGFGALMELGQRWCPGRVAAWTDVARNATGSALGVLAAAWLWT